MADALMWAQMVDSRMVVSNANAWNWWLLVNNNAVDNQGLMSEDGSTIAKRAYMLGNYGKFVRPGFYRIDATHTPQAGVLVSAYKNTATGILVIVAINQTGSAISQEFALNGTTVSNITPWTTSKSLNLVQQANVSVNGGSFTYALPASSVTTIVGATSIIPMPPTGLTVTLQ